MKMKKIEKPKKGKITDELSGTNWAEKVWGTSWTYIRTVVDTAREPFIILDHNLRVIAANEKFYETFKFNVKDTEDKLVYDLGDGQWNISTLRKLLEDILPKDTFFRGFEVDNEFQKIGRKVMLLNARRVYQEVSKGTEPIILLAIEDITDITVIAEKLANKTKEYETKMIERSEELELRISELSYLNKTVVGFNSSIAELASVVDSLRANIVALKEK
jgi:hypothetical protein